MDELASAAKVAQVITCELPNSAMPRLMYFTWATPVVARMRMQMYLRIAEQEREAAMNSSEPIGGVAPSQRRRTPRLDSQQPHLTRQLGCRHWRPT